MIRPPALAAAWLALSAGTAAAASQLVDFDSDPIGPVPDGFVSDDSPLVSFSASFGANLEIGDFGAQTDFTQGLANAIDDTTGIWMDFAAPVRGLSFDYGNDDATFLGAPVFGTVVAFLDFSLVASITFATNMNDIMDETFGLGPVVVDRVFFTYTDANGTQVGLAELIDNVAFTAAVPVPPALPLLAGGAAALALLRPRRPAA